MSTVAASKIRATRTNPRVIPAAKESEETRALAVKLLRADTENEVIDLLRAAGYWDNPDAWRNYGDNENNFSIIGNQQSQPEAALVEKIVNSIDSTLMLKAKQAGVAIEPPGAPPSIMDAVELFYGGNGNVAQWDRRKRFEVAQDIQVVATGAGPKDGQPSFTVVDQGEGLTPDSFPETILSLGKTNKLRIPFVQGKYNQGGSGALKFCGKHNIQLIISRRHPALLSDSASGRDHDWGITVVRREDPSGGRRSSVYTYLAPVGSKEHPGRGTVLSFRAKAFGILPLDGDPYGKEAEHGTLVKLYEYDTAFRQQIPRNGSMLERLDLLLPKAALPFRIYEGRSEYWQNAEVADRDLTRNLARTVSGIQVRLADDLAAKSRDNVEFEFSTEIKIDGQPLRATIYAFKRGKAKAYRRNEGVIFTVNGQTHGNISDNIFRRKAVGMSYLQDSLLVIVDATNISGRHREDLFMTSRDRLADTTFRQKIEKRLEEILADNQRLQDLREQRRREHNRMKIEEARPMESAVKLLLEANPTMHRIFGKGETLPRPEEVEIPEEEPEVEDVAAEEFVGLPNPTFFKLRGYNEGTVLNRKIRPKGSLRVQFETDVENDYFTRDTKPGKFGLTMVNVDDPKGKAANVEDYTLVLHDGIATLSVPTPKKLKPGANVMFTTTVSDPKLKRSWIHQIRVEVMEPERKEKTPKEDKKQPDGLKLPEIREVYKEPKGNDWGWDDMEPAFDKTTALRIVHAGTGANETPIYDFYVNMDNIHLKAEMAAQRDEQDIVRTKWVTAQMIQAMLLIRDEEESDDEGEDQISIEEKVEMFSRAQAAGIVPLLEVIGELDIEKVLAD